MEVAEAGGPRPVDLSEALSFDGVRETAGAIATQLGGRVGWVTLAGRAPKVVSAVDLMRTRVESWQLSRHVVKVTGMAVAGLALFVASGWVLTCAHVAREAEQVS